MGIPKQGQAGVPVTDFRRPCREEDVASRKCGERRRATTKRVLLCALSSFWMVSAINLGEVRADQVWFSLRSIAPDGTSRCLEGNDPAHGSVLSGAAFADLCQRVTGQSWAIRPLADGHFQLQTAYLGRTHCLLPSRGDRDALPRGTAMMRSCPTDERAFVAQRTSDSRLRLVLLDANSANPLCLAFAKGKASGAASVPAVFEPCNGSNRQLWTVAGEGRETLFNIAQDRGKRVETAMTARCLWDDGAGDNADRFPCRIDHIDEHGSFRAIGTLYTYELRMQSDGKGPGRATISRREIVTRLGQFVPLLRKEGCWSNALTGARFCVTEDGTEPGKAAK